MLANDRSIRITEIFSSLQGESSYAGLPTTFVRLTGCPLRCVYCDSAYAFSGGKSLSINEVLATVAKHDNNYVCVTGGEPLAQPECIPLLKELADRGYAVSLETSGAIDAALVDERVKRIIDVKTPSSGECARNLIDNTSQLRRTDELKFVIADREDFDWSVEFLATEDYYSRVSSVLFSPVFSLPDDSQENPTIQSDVMAELASWILEAAIPVRFQLQLHKLLWGDQPGK